MREHRLLLCLAVIATSCAASAQESPILVLVTDVWRAPIPEARVYAGTAPHSGTNPLALSGEDGRCTVSVNAGEFITVDHFRFAPLVMRIEQSDIDRGYVTAILYKGGAIRADFRVGGRPVESDYIVLQYTDPLIFGGFIQTKSARDGNVRFTNVPEGLAYLTVGARVGGALRTSTTPVQVRNEATNYMQLGITLGTAAIQGRVTGPGGTPASATLSGTFIFDRRIEELRGETDSDGTFELSHLPEVPLILRATLDQGLMKRTDFALADDTVVEREIRFDEGATVAVTIENAPEFDWIDVFLIDAAITRDQVRDPTDRATYLRSALMAQLQSKSTRTSIPGVSPGQYRVVALTTRAENDGATTTVSEFHRITVDETEEVEVRVQFPSSE